MEARNWIGLKYLTLLNKCSAEAEKNTCRSTHYKRTDRFYSIFVPTLPTFLRPTAEMTAMRAV